MSTRIVVLLLLAVWQVGASPRVFADPPAAPTKPAKWVLAHYMPWFEAKSVSSHWGWHWTMQAFDPEQSTDGRPNIASHYRPQIGPYDSSDAAVLEYQLLTMKLAGIDGVIVDWYGLTDFRDYAVLHRNTTRLLEAAERLKLKFVVCYEDQTIPALVADRRLAATDRVAHAVREIQWLSRYWFKSRSYLLLDGKPVLLSFGQTGLTDAEWSQCLGEANVPAAYFSQQERRAAAVGAFDWPAPSEPAQALERFRRASREWPSSIPVAFPRFVDIYAEAKVGPSYGRIDDDNGKSFRQMLETALTSNASLVQIATWNDWGEGTMIEPSREFGYRDLETVLELRRRHTPQAGIASKADDLRLPARLLERRRSRPSAEASRQLDDIATSLADGKLAEARIRLE